MDKYTAVRMHDKVQRLWKAEIKALRGQIKNATSSAQATRLKRRLAYMKQVEMAVVMSEEADEEEKFTQQGLDIKPHRARLNRLDEYGHDVEYNFKEAEHPLQLVFVCAMWLTGFDAPTLSTLYLDKPQRDHTLMQTIARANRVTSHVIQGVTKRHGEIIDYYGVFRNMKQALAAYAHGDDVASAAPVRAKSELAILLDQALSEGRTFLLDKDIDLYTVLDETQVFKNLGQFNAFADTLFSNDAWRKGFNVYENTISSLYEACKPEILGQPVVRHVAAFQYLRGVLDTLIHQQDIDNVTRKIAELLDESVVVDNADQFLQHDPQASYRIIKSGKTWDLSKLDIDALRHEYQHADYKHLEIADLRAFLERKLEQMLARNVTRADFAQRLQSIIDRYNAGSSTADNYFDELIRFTKDLQDESERHIREGLSEEELELFDLLKKPSMTKDETRKVRLAAKTLYRRLKEEEPNVLVQDWYKDTQTQHRVRQAMEEVLDAHLPDSYDHKLFTDTCQALFTTMLGQAQQGQRWMA